VKRGNRVNLCNMQLAQGEGPTGNCQYGSLNSLLAFIDGCQDITQYRRISISQYSILGAFWDSVEVELLPGSNPLLSGLRFEYRIPS
jgi:hypothetical protein